MEGPKNAKIVNRNSSEAIWRENDEACIAENVGKGDHAEDGRVEEAVSGVADHPAASGRNVSSGKGAFERGESLDQLESIL
jgi:hypothetical protein